MRNPVPRGGRRCIACHFVLATIVGDDEPGNVPLVVGQAALPVLWVRWTGKLPVLRPSLANRYSLEALVVWSWCSRCPEAPLTRGRAGIC